MLFFWKKKPKCVLCKKNQLDPGLKNENSQELIKFLNGLHVDPKDLCKECLVHFGELEVKCRNSRSTIIITGSNLQKLFKDFFEKINQ